MTAIPYDWGEAKAAFERASIAQLNAEQFVRDAYKDWAAAERAYRLALAECLLRLRAAGTAATLCQDLARGTKHVADLRFDRDMAEGVKEAARNSHQWRASADRRGLEQLVAWSMRVAPDGQHDDEGENR